MKILLTGSSGQVGHELACALGMHGELVLADHAQMDLQNPTQIRDVIRSVQPQLIINPAAYTAVDQAESEPDLAMRINVEAPAVMAEEAKKLGAAMIHYSTDYVFDGTKPGAYTEQDVPNPQSVYGRSKLAGEQAVQSAGIPHLILRTSWVYGLHGRNFLLTIKRLAREREELRIVADQIGAPTWSRTVATATASVVRSLQLPMPDHDAWLAQSGVYHLTAQGHTSWYDFAKAIVSQDELVKKPRILPIKTAEYPLPARRPANSMLSCEKFIRAFGSLPPWDDALSVCMRK